MQDKNKYAAPKYRLVVRITNRYVICQIVYASVDKDQVYACANSSELSKYGLTIGLKNYAAAYCTGLLVARRALAKMNLADKYEGNTEIDGKVVKINVEGRDGKKSEHYVAKMDDEKKPFRVYLDVGIRVTTTGARIFGAMKGATDGGLDIPHNEKRFPGYNRDNKKCVCPGRARPTASLGRRRRARRLLAALAAARRQRANPRSPSSLCPGTTRTS